MARTKRTASVAPKFEVVLHIYDGISHLEDKVLRGSFPSAEAAKVAGLDYTRYEDNMNFSVREVK